MRVWASLIPQVILPKKKAHLSPHVFTRGAAGFLRQSQDFLHGVRYKGLCTVPRRLDGPPPFFRACTMPPLSHSVHGRAGGWMGFALCNIGGREKILGGSFMPYGIGVHGAAISDETLFCSSSGFGPVEGCTYRRSIEIGSCE